MNTVLPHAVIALDVLDFTVSLSRQESSESMGEATEEPCPSEDYEGADKVERRGSSRHLGNDDHLLPSNTLSVRKRKRPSEEIKELQAQIADLQKTFATLVHALKVDGEAQDDDDEIPWKLRADLGGRKVNAVLLENQKLKMMLAGRLRVAQAFQQAIDRNVRLLARKLPWPSGSDRQSLSDELIFALLDEEKEYQLPLTDEVMEAGGIARTNHRVQSRIQFRQNGVFHHDEVRELPFPVPDVAAALRNCLAHGAKADTAEPKLCRKLCMKENSFYAVTVETVGGSGVHLAQVKARLLQRCVSEPNRTIITWTCYHEYDGYRYVRLLQRIWVSIEPFHFNKTDVIGSILRMAVRITPVEGKCDLEEAAHIEEMADVVTAAFYRNADIVFKAMIEQLRASTR